MIRLTDEQWERIRIHFPEEHIADGRPGRKPIPTRRVLEAVLWLLNTGAQWHMLPQSYPNYKTVHRRFQAWCRDEILRRLLTDVANELRDRGALDEKECFIDATFVMAKGGGAEIGATKRGKGMKIMAIVDRHGLPLSVSTHAANHHEVRLVQLCFDFYMIEAKPENLIGDRAYDSDPMVRKHFDDDRIRTLFTSYMHVITTESVPGAGIVFPLIFANVMEFTLPVGGSASFTCALARVIEACGGLVMTGADVKEVVVRNGRAAAVRLADGHALEGSRFIASAIDAPTTMRMVGEDRFPEDVRKKLNGWHWGNHSLVTLHLALRDKPVYHSAEFDPDIDRAFNIFFGMDDIEQVRSCFDHCAVGKFPHVLMGNGACNSAVDPTYAPTNGHSAFWWPFAPYAVDGEADNWDRQRDEYTDRVLAVWREYASNLDDGNVRAKLLFTPLDIERLNVNMVRGAVRMGAYIPSQLGINRPHPLLSGTRTPIESLYLCGSSTGNGGGINGAPGYIAANAIADDLGLERPWARVPAPEWRH